MISPPLIPYVYLTNEIGGRPPVISTSWNDPNDGDNIDADIYIYILHYDVKIARFSLRKILEFIKYNN